MTNKSPGLDRFATEFCQNLKEELMLRLLKLLYKMERQGHMQTHSNILDDHRYKEPHKNTCKLQAREMAQR